MGTNPSARMLLAIRRAFPVVGGTSSKSQMALVLITSTLPGSTRFTAASHEFFEGRAPRVQACSKRSIQDKMVSPLMFTLGFDAALRISAANSTIKHVRGQT